MTLLRDQLREAIDKFEKAREPEAPTESAEVVSEPVETPVEAATEPAEKPERVRGPDGKFVKAEAVEAEATEEAPQEKPLECPKSLRKEFKGDKWSSLPRDWQEELIRRETDVDKLAKNRDEESAFGKSLKEVVGPYMPMITAQGSDAPTVVKNMLNTAYFLHTASPEQKKTAILNLAKQHGVDLGIPQDDKPYVDPTVESLQQRLDRLERERQEEVLNKKKAEDELVASQISQFAQTHPHFDTVRATMGALMNSGASSTMEDAYDKATKAFGLAPAKPVPVPNKRAAASSVAGSPGSQPAGTSNANLSRRDSISRAFDEVLGR